MIVSGSSSSRLSELRKYTITNVFADQYVGGGTLTVNGVDYPNSISGESVVYFLGGIKYLDKIIEPDSGTTFNFIAEGTNSADFIHTPIYKDPKKENIISNPKIDDDVFIIRQELSVFEKNFRLEYVKNLVELTTYAGGNYFNIINNS